MIDHKIFPQRPYESELAKEFIHAVKVQQMDTVQNLLARNRFLVFHFDYYNMTCLHWSAKKGHFRITKLLLEHGADADGVDVLGRNPLYHAVENNHFEIVVVTLSPLIH